MSGGGGGSGNIDVSGTPANNQLTIWEDADTIKGESTLNFSNEEGLVINNASVGPADTGLKVHGNIFGSGSHIRLRDVDTGGGSGFYVSSSGGTQRISGNSSAQYSLFGAYKIIE